MTGDYNVPTTHIEGEYTDAIVFLDRDEMEDKLYQQIQQLTNAPGFLNTIRVMPDSHWSQAGSPVGFSMPFESRVVPSAVGTDQGCGVYAGKIEDYDIDPHDKDDLLEVDECVRTNVPMGLGQYHNRNTQTYNMRDDFPWDTVNEKWRTMAEENLLPKGIDLGDVHPDEFEYDVTFLEELKHRIEADKSKISEGVGSLGASNHFVELSLSDSDELWASVHSGSRSVGHTAATHHHERAVELRNMQATREAIRSFSDEHRQYLAFDVDDVSDHQLHQWLHNRQHVDYDALKDEFENTPEAHRIEEISDELNGLTHEVNEELNDKLAYLEDEEMVQYLVDLAFTQTYAEESRREMARAVARCVGGEIVDEINSVHNYIDYEDGVIRKGATPAHEGRRAIIPMNMSHGSYIVRGKGNGDWLNTCPHGGGRSMSRGQAYDELSEEEHAEIMGDTVATELPLDESPRAYKRPEMVRERIKSTIEVVDHLEPVLNIKADD